jgi:hypothetical protein
LRVDIWGPIEGREFDGNLVGIGDKEIPQIVVFQVGIEEFERFFLRGAKIAKVPFQVSRQRHFVWFNDHFFFQKSL